MNYAERLENVTVLGAAGKMGSGILLLTVLEMADLSLQNENKNRSFVLHAVDVSHQALTGLMHFLKAQVLKAAEKKVVQLRSVYKDREDLIENQDIINQYIFDVMTIVRPTTRIEAAYDSSVIFEAIVENPEVKVKLLSQIDRNNTKSPWFFTNTSSIPIHELDERAELGGRIIGFHFYNPPAVQKLAELIRAEKTLPELAEFSLAYAKNLKKKVVPSNDVAGFIGNGHFMRDALHGFAETQRLSQAMSFPEAVYIVNKVTQDYLVRPMGIFQLVDYVGLDVCRYIMSVMDPYVKDENLHSDLLDQFTDMGIKGGQFSDGSQKDGFLKYEKGRPTGVYDPATSRYVPYSDIQAKGDQWIGAAPPSLLPWKTVIGMPNKDEALQTFFRELNGMTTPGAELAKRYGKRSMAIAKKLVADKVALCEADVNTVLLTGFFHSFGPINEYFN
ncbi:MAG: 3-hydroxyacyl-CoA dehydrogenase family protein [Candidatus Omnitrophota bacterium]